MFECLARASCKSEKVVSARAPSVLNFVGMKSIYVLLFAVLPLSACIVSYEPGTATVTAQPANAQPANTQEVRASEFKLRAYPSASTFKREESRDKLKWEFGTSNDLARVYAHFHTQLTQQGWRRTELEQKGAATKLGATYIKNARELELKLDQKGKSGRYKLEVETDD